MKIKARKRLEKAGWKVGSTSDFLNLALKEKAAVEAKLLMEKTGESCRLSNTGMIG
jgi:hypothetical protein